MEYMIFNRDDSPLYMFESSIQNPKRGVTDLIKEYEVPKFFDDDYYKLLGEDPRPPYRWFLCGSKRSGTTMHTDPLHTSAWNASLQGHKYWILFPPEEKAEVAKGKRYKYKGEDNEAIHFFHTIYPRMLEAGEVKKRYEFI